MHVFNEQFRKLSEGANLPPFRFEFINRIPISRGLGSSSAVIVSAITAAHLAVGVKFNKRKVLNISLKYESHPDNITPAVMGGFNVACIDQDRVYSKKRKLPSYLKAILVVPNRTISTVKSRTVLPNSYL